MNVASSLIADLQTSWYSLHDLDRAQELKSIHQLGVSLRTLSSALNCSPSLLTHLLQAGQAPPEDCLLARQGLLSTRALVRRARAVGARRTALHREEIAYERELAALRFSQAIGRWLDEKGVESTDRESVIEQAAVLSSQGRGQGDDPVERFDGLCSKAGAALRCLGVPGSEAPAQRLPGNQRRPRQVAHPARRPGVEIECQRRSRSPDAPGHPCRLFRLWEPLRSARWQSQPLQSGRRTAGCPRTCGAASA